MSETLTLEQAVKSKPMPGFAEWWPMGERFTRFMSQAIVAEGTYTTLLKNVDSHVFIARNRLDTLEHRKKRGREKIEPFIEEVLKIEHAIISKHRELAEVIITRDYEVEFPEK